MLCRLVSIFAFVIHAFFFFKYTIPLSIYVCHLRMRIASSGDQSTIEKLQTRLAVSESMFDHDRAIFEEQLKYLRKELERTQKRLVEVTAENEKNVRYILLVFM